MAKRRMISAEVIGSDAFITLPLSAHGLYVHLNVAADDDGFISSAIRTMRAVGATEEDLQSLVDAGFLLRFESGIYLVTHWFLHNQIKKDRYAPTIHQKELSLVQVVDKVYCLTAAPVSDSEQLRDGTAVDPKRLQGGSDPEPQTRKEKISKEQNRQVESEGNDPPAFSIPSVNDLRDYANGIGYFGFNPEKFLAYYGSRNWKLPGGMPVTDWRMQVDSWKAREGDYKPEASSPKQPSWKPANQHDYDFEELEKKLIAN